MRPVGRKRARGVRDAHDVGVGAVAGGRDEDEAPPGGQEAREGDQRSQAVRVVRVVHDDRRAADVPDVGAAGIVARVAPEGAQAVRERLVGHIQGGARRDGREGVEDVVAGGSTHRGRHLGDGHERRPRAIAADGDVPVYDGRGERGAREARMVGVVADPDEATRGERVGLPVGFGAGRAVVGREDERAASREAFRDDELDAGERLDALDAILAEVVVRDVGDARDGCAPERDAAAQQPAPRHLEHTHRRPPVAKGRPCAHRPREVARLDHVRPDGDVVGRGHAGDVAGSRRHCGEHADRRRLAVRARDERDRDVVEAVPFDRVGLGQGAGVPRVPAGAEAERDRVVVPKRAHAVHLGRAEQRAERVVAVPVREVAQPGDDVIDRLPARLARLPGIRQSRRRLVQLGRDVEGIDVGGDGERHAARTRPGGDGRHIPPERARESVHVRAPRSDEPVCVGQARRFERGAGGVEKSARARLAAAVSDGEGHSGLKG